MFQDLLQKAILFAKLYEEKKDLSLLVNCEQVPEYKEILKVLSKFTLKDLCLDDKSVAESFVPNHISAVTLVESPMMSIGYFFLPAGMYKFNWAQNLFF